MGKGVNPDDLTLPFQSHEAVFSLMSPDVSKLVGLCCLKVLLDSKMMKTDDCESLETEIVSQTCILVPAQLGSVLRIIPITLVKVHHSESEDEHFLVSLGKFKNGKLQMDCKLPGCRDEPGEDSSSALGRILGKELRWLADSVVMGDSTFNVTEKESKSHGVVSRYLQTVYSGALSSSWEDTSVSQYFRGLRDTRKSITSLRRSTIRFTQTPNITSPTGFQCDRIIAVGGEDCTRFFAWLPVADFTHFRSAYGHQDFIRWFDSFNVEDPECPGCLREPDRVAAEPQPDRVAAEPRRQARAIIDL